MLEEHIALAFHAMRAMDGRFQMTIQKDFGADVGRIEAIPQDLSRVFLNIVTNACQATFEKALSEYGFRMGYGAAIAVVLFLIMLGFIAYFLWSMHRQERAG